MPPLIMRLSQVLFRLNQAAAAQAELERHQQIAVKRPNIPNDPTFFEKSRHTLARLPEVPPEQPSLDGVKVVFTDATQSAFGEAASRFHGPIGVIDADRDGQYGLLVAETDQGFRLLENENGAFRPRGELLSGIPDAKYGRSLVGDLNNDRLEDAIVLSDKGAMVFALADDGTLSDVTSVSGLRAVVAHDGLLADLDFTGKLGLVVAGEQGVAVFRNQGDRVFHNVTEAFGIPAGAAPAHQLAVDDWNGDDLPDLFIGRNGQPPQLLLNQHGGGMKPGGPEAERLAPTTDVSRPSSGAGDGSLQWPSGGVLAPGDLNNDRRVDLAIATADGIEVVFGGLKDRAKISVPGFSPATLALLDYDNDGWLDVLAAADRVRIWRNLGRAGFRESTAELGLTATSPSRVESIAAVDFDDDGDTDLVISAAGQGLQFLRNDGGNANRQIKVRLIGKRSNASGLGVPASS